nr:divergent polysaccharide deacetylase family protein [Pseudaestuariivita rosea]
MPDSGRALADNAVDFSNPQNKPLLSLVLVDDGAAPIDMSLLEQLRNPVAIAVDVTRDDLAQVTRAYRDAGHEVVMMTNLPGQVQPGDIEVAFESYRATMPEAIAVYEAGGQGFQSQPRLVSQLVEILNGTGHGLVTVSSGLNSTQRVAQREGLPSVAINRSIDDRNASDMTIRRNLDSAILRARRDGFVVLIGQLKPETLTAVSTWVGSGRADDVAVAPLSAVLLRQ